MPFPEPEYLADSVFFHVFKNAAQAAVAYAKSRSRLASVAEIQGKFFHDFPAAEIRCLSAKIVIVASIRHRGCGEGGRSKGQHVSVPEYFFKAGQTCRLIAQQHQIAFQNGHQFAHIARPVVGLESFLYFRSQCLFVLAVAAQQGGGEQGDVLKAVPERGNLKTNAR